jgi:hypothetical protein
VRRLAHRIGLYRVAAILVGCALAVEILRNEVLPRTSTMAVVSTVVEVFFLALAAATFVTARRAGAR